MMEGFIRCLDKTAPLKIIDVGSRIELGQPECYRQLMISEKWTYQGLDLKAGSNVDIISDDPFNYPITDNEYDVIISGQCIEHVTNLAVWMKELYRILKPGGRICIIGPSAGGIHRHPVDCWRVLPDGMRFLFENEGFINIDVQRSGVGPWYPCIGTAKKP